MELNTEVSAEKFSFLWKLTLDYIMIASCYIRVRRDVGNECNSCSESVLSFTPWLKVRCDVYLLSLMPLFVFVFIG